MALGRNCKSYGIKRIIEMLKLEDREPYHFSRKGIAKIEKHYNAKYLGYWCIRDRIGNWSDVPVEVFYQPLPDFSKGHSHYFGLYVLWDNVMITNAKSAFSSEIAGIVEDGIVYASRYRRDCTKTPSGSSIDGGRDYMWLNGDSELKLVSVNINNGLFEFNTIQSKIEEGTK